MCKTVQNVFGKNEQDKIYTMSPVSVLPEAGCFTGWGVTGRQFPLPADPVGGAGADRPRNLLPLLCRLWRKGWDPGLVTDHGVPIPSTSLLQGGAEVLNPVLSRGYFAAGGRQPLLLHLQGLLQWRYNTH